MDGKCHSLTASHIRVRHKNDSSVPICGFYEVYIRIVVVVVLVIVSAAAAAGGTVLISTDRQALLRATDSYADSVSEVTDLLNKTPGLGLTLQWVPGHCGVPGNEMADQQGDKPRNTSRSSSRPRQCHLSY